MWHLKTVCFFGVLLLASVARTQQTECNQQLHNYYVGLGIPLATPVQPVIQFTTGVLLGTPFVTVTFLGQEAARFYDALLPSPPPPNSSYSSYFTLNLPWCSTGIIFQCCDNATLGTVKTSNCTTIVDFDLGAPNPDAGRLFVYSNQTFGCDGIPSLTFPNVTLTGASNDTYTYDLYGIRNQALMPWQTAQNTYRSSTCQFTDGSPASLVNQQQFVCTEPQMQCNGTRGKGSPTLQVIPTPQFACIGTPFANSTVKRVIWKVLGMQPPYGIQGTYGAFFVTNPTDAIGLEQTYSAIGKVYLLIPSTVSQFDSHIDSMNQFGYFFYQNQWNGFQPTYAFSKDPLIATVPCLCGFSIFCDVNGSVDLTQPYAGILLLNNALPICNAGLPQEIAIGLTEFVLNGTGSFDPDNAPYAFNVLWRVYSTPYDPSPPPFTLTDPTNATQVINATGLQAGTYLFVLYASDLQSQVPCIANVTIVPVQVFAVTQEDAIVLFTFYSGFTPGHSCSFFPPAPTLPVLGNWSYATDPSVTLTYEWTQTCFYPLTYTCDPNGFTPTSAILNTTQAILQFVPPRPGTYCFQLNVSYMAAWSTASVSITVEPDFQQPNQTLTPITNFTQPPLRNLTPPSRPILTFPPSSEPPFTLQPPFPPPPPYPNTSVPPLIPPVPPLTPSDWVIVGVWSGVVIAFALFVAAMFILYSDENRMRVFEKRQYGGRFTMKLKQQ